MSTLELRPPEDCRWALVSLGEVMLRLDPGDRRIRAARRFDAWEGGGEYNVARALRRCFGLPTAVVTSLVDNEVGRLIEDLMLQGGVDVSHVRWRPHDGVGRAARNGLNFTERGFGVRAAVGCSDRGHSAASLLEPGQVDWKRVFREQGARWFHCGGIFAALSESAADVVAEAMTEARACGVVVSYDLNYRASLWQDRGGPAACQAVNRRLAPLVDVMLGNEEDFSVALGFPVDGVGDDYRNLDTAAFADMIDRVRQTFGGLRVVATTLRTVKTATINDWGAVLWDGGNLYEATHREDLEIYDRVGGGDSFASGLIYGYLSGMSPDRCVEYGAAHGALAMTTPGDTSTATLDQVENLVAGAGARVRR